MSHLLDTDICIYWLKGRPEVKERLQVVGLDRVAISVITVAELYFGAYNSARVDENLTRACTFAKQITVLPLDDAVLAAFGRLKAELRRQGQPLPDFDLLIAATALAQERILVTNNVRHYKRIPDVQLENWIAS